MTECCPNCGEPLPGGGDPVALEAERIKDWCRDSGVPVVLGDCLKLKDAADYLGRTEKTLQNWLYSHGSPLEVRRVHRRYYITLYSLAKFVIDEK